MKLDLKAMRKHPRSPFDFQTTESWEQMDHRGRTLHYTRDVSVSGEATLRNDTVHVWVEIDTTLAVECSRCLTPIPTTIELEEHFKLYAEPEGGFEGLPIEGFGYSNGADELELRPYIERLIDSSIATKPLCNDDCQGICPDCGQDLNLGACECASRQPVDPRLEKLKELLA